MSDNPSQFADGSYTLSIGDSPEIPTAAKALAADTGLSVSRVKQAMDRGAVWLQRGKHTQRLRRGSRVLQPGDILYLHYQSKVLDSPVPEARLIADEGAYSLWYKPSGALSQGSKWGDHCTMVRIAEKQLSRPGFIVHRLDRAASGLILIAHEKKAAAALSALFAERSIDKRYWVSVAGEFPEALRQLDSPLDGKAARSLIEACVYHPETGRSDLLVKIETGRKHQIRQHLAEVGYPVIGDRLYGSELGGEDLCLQAVSLRFSCPLSGVERHYRLPLPKALEGQFNI